MSKLEEMQCKLLLIQMLSYSVVVHLLSLLLPLHLHIVNTFRDAV